MGSYYYLMAQLPALSFGAPAPMPSADCAELCRRLMGDADAALLERCALDPPKKAPCGSAVLDGWTEFEGALRAALARLRASALGRDASALPEPPAHPADASAAAKSALGVDSPLEAEGLLDKARWDAVDSLAGLDGFSRDAAYAYVIKLRILERRSLFAAEEGFGEYKAVYAAVLATAPAGGESGVPK